MIENTNRKNPSGKKKWDADAWWEDRSLPQKILWGILFGVAGLGLLAACGWVVMALWNWLMPEIFGLGRVNYWQAWGLLVLSSILFKNVGGAKSDASGDRKRRRQLRSYVRDAECVDGTDSDLSAESAPQA